MEVAAVQWWVVELSWCWGEGCVVVGECVVLVAMCPLYSPVQYYKRINVYRDRKSVV